MRLELSKKYSKPIFIYCPPQIWAWKSKRAYSLQDVTLGVLYDFERELIKFDCPSLKIENPFLQGAVSLMKENRIKGVTFIPSRK